MKSSKNLIKGLFITFIACLILTIIFICISESCYTYETVHVGSTSYEHIIFYGQVYQGLAFTCTIIRVFSGLIGLYLGIKECL